LAVNKDTEVEKCKGRCSDRHKQHRFAEFCCHMSSLYRRKIRTEERSDQISKSNLGCRSERLVDAKNMTVIRGRVCIPTLCRPHTPDPFLRRNSQRSISRSLCRSGRSKRDYKRGLMRSKLLLPDLRLVGTVCKTKSTAAASTST
jgi:hypothetical protein